MARKLSGSLFTFRSLFGYSLGIPEYFGQLISPFRAAQDSSCAKNHAHLRIYPDHGSRALALHLRNSRAAHQKRLTREPDRGEESRRESHSNVILSARVQIPILGQERVHDCERSEHCNQKKARTFSNLRLQRFDEGCK
ncbi:MAG: hypothetical protein RIS22_542 [Actinomycetota bacterium]